MHVGALGLVLCVAALSWLGYEFTAWQLSQRLLQTAYLALTLALLNGFGARWLRLVRGRLALELVNERRAAQQQAAESELFTEEEAEEAVQSEVGLATVNQHKQKKDQWIPKN